MRYWGSFMLHLNSGDLHLYVFSKCWKCIICSFLTGHTAGANRVPEADQTGDDVHQEIKVVHAHDIGIAKVVHLDAVAIVKRVVRAVIVEGVILGVLSMAAMDRQRRDPQGVKAWMRVAVVREIDHVVLMLNGKEVAAEVDQMVIRAAESRRWGQMT